MPRGARILFAFAALWLIAAVDPEVGLERMPCAEVRIDLGEAAKEAGISPQAISGALYGRIYGERGGVADPRNFTNQTGKGVTHLPPCADFLYFHLELADYEDNLFDAEVSMAVLRPLGGSLRKVWEVNYRISGRARSFTSTRLRKLVEQPVRDFYSAWRAAGN